MTRSQYTKAIELELDRLNKKIDAKIIQGRNYSAESKQHKVLLQKMMIARSKQPAHSTPSLLGRLLFAFN